VSFSIFIRSSFALIFSVLIFRGESGRRALPDCLMRY
jgi:hypothetical protein